MPIQHNITRATNSRANISIDLPLTRQRVPLPATGEAWGTPICRIT